LCGKEASQSPFNAIGETEIEASRRYRKRSDQTVMVSIPEGALQPIVSIRNAVSGGSQYFEVTKGRVIRIVKGHVHLQQAS